MPESHNAKEILYEETCLSAVQSCAYPVHAGFSAIELQVTISQKKKKLTGLQLSHAAWARLLSGVVTFIKISALFTFNKLEDGDSNENVEKVMCFTVKPSQAYPPRFYQ